MRRIALLAGLLFLSAFLSAQESQKQEAQPTPAEARQTGWSTAADPETGANPVTTAPGPAYPPRPRDIDILTGKADRESRAQGERGYPYVYMYGPGTGYAWQGGWRRHSVPFSAFGFRRFGGHGVRVFTVPRGRFFPRF